MDKSIIRTGSKTGLILLFLSVASLSFAQDKPSYNDLVLDILNLKNQASNLKLEIAKTLLSGDTKSLSDKCEGFLKEQEVYRDIFYSKRQYVSFLNRKANSREERYLQSSVENLLIAVGDRAAVINTLCKTKGPIGDGHYLYSSEAFLAGVINSTQNASLFEELAELVSN